MHIARSALVTHSALDMYRLVHDVVAYPGFLSWCTSAEVHEDTPELQVASLSINVGGMTQTFTTRNRLERGERQPDPVGPGSPGRADLSAHFKFRHGDGESWNGSFVASPWRSGRRGENE